MLFFKLTLFSKKLAFLCSCRVRMVNTTTFVKIGFWLSAYFNGVFILELWGSYPNGKPGPRGFWGGSPTCGVIGLSLTDFARVVFPSQWIEFVSCLALLGARSATLRPRAGPVAPFFPNHQSWRSEKRQTTNRPLSFLSSSPVYQVAVAS